MSDGQPSRVDRWFGKYWPILLLAGAAYLFTSGVTGERTAANRDDMSWGAALGVIGAYAAWRKRKEGDY